MRVLTPVLLDAYPERVLNIHPSLLPAFPGLKGPAQALAHGARVAGCTVHLVTAGVDAGPIVAQGACPVQPGDTADTLAARILRLEHTLLPQVVGWAAQGRLRVEAGRVVLDLPPGHSASIWTA
jgi:phosphoribosylglycinamide formyltransferase-1